MHVNDFSDLFLARLLLYYVLNIDMILNETIFHLSFLVFCLQYKLQIGIKLWPKKNVAFSNRILNFAEFFRLFSLKEKMMNRFMKKISMIEHKKFENTI